MLKPSAPLKPLKPVAPLKCFALIVSISCGLLLAAEAAGAPVSPGPIARRNQQQDAANAASAYSAGVSLVYRNRRLETAAQHLAEAVRRAPRNPEYRLALGCALVRRAAVLRRAAISAVSYDMEKPEYPSRYRAWEQAQLDRNNALYGTAPPPVPAPPVTVDDGKPFTLTRAQTGERAADLCRRARAEWDAAATMAATDRERANVNYVRGWGMILIRRLAPFFVQVPPGSENRGTTGQDDPWREEKLVPRQQQIAEQFQAALAIAPNSALYWQSLGDAYVADLSPKEWDRKKAAAAYEKALTLDRRSPTLWYQLYEMQEQIDPAAAAEAIEKAAQIDVSNSYYWFLLADLRLKRYVEETKNEANTPSTAPETRYPGRHGSPDLSAGLAALEKGNAGTFRPVSYLFAVPRILAPLNPIDIGVTDALYDSYILGIPQNVDAAVKAHLAAGDAEAAVAAARTLVGFSDTMVSLGETHTNAGNEYLAWMYNLTPIHFSYTSLATALEQAGDAAGAAQARAKMQEREAMARKRLQRGKELLGL